METPQRQARLEAEAVDTLRAPVEQVVQEGLMVEAEVVEQAEQLQEALVAQAVLVPATSTRCKYEKSIS